MSRDPDNWTFDLHVRGAMRLLDSSAATDLLNELKRLVTVRVRLLWIIEGKQREVIIDPVYCRWYKIAVSGPLPQDGGPESNAIHLAGFVDSIPERKPIRPPLQGVGDA